MRRTIAALLLATGLVTGLGACQPGGPDQIDEEALDAVALAIEDQMNEPAAAIMGLLRAASGEAQVGWDTLIINLDGTPEPVNWWLQQRGLLEMSGAQFATRAAFTLSKSANDILANPDEPWFEAKVTGEPLVDCKTPAALAANGCEVEIEVTPALTPAGRAMAGALPPMQPFAATAVVTLGPEDWIVGGLTTEGSAPREIAMTTILGAPARREEAARAADGRMKGQLSMLAGEREPEINLEAYTPPNYIEPPPPVRAIEPPKGNGRDSPFRPGN